MTMTSETKLLQNLKRTCVACMSSVTLVSHIPHQRVAVRPAEIILNGFIIQTSPLVFLVVVW